MRFTDVYELPCPSADDYAAFPLAMRRVADRLEELALANALALAEFRGQPAGIWRTTATLGPFAAAVGWPILPTLLPEYTSNFAPPGGDPIPPERGVYLYGWYANTVETGGVTAGSLRQINVAVQRPDATVTAGLATISTSSYALRAESIAGGSFLSGMSTFVVDFDPSTTTFALSFTHENAASTVQIPAAGFVLWFVRLGDANAPVEVS